MAILQEIAVIIPRLAQFGLSSYNGDPRAHKLLRSLLYGFQELESSGTTAVNDGPDGRARGDGLLMRVMRSGDAQDVRSHSSLRRCIMELILTVWQI